MAFIILCQILVKREMVCRPCEFLFRKWQILHIQELLLTTLTSGPNFCMIVAENAAPANNRR